MSTVYEPATSGKTEVNHRSLSTPRDTKGRKKELTNSLVKESPLERMAGQGLEKIALKAGCMVDNFPFANIRSEAAIFNNSNWYPDVNFSY